MRNNPLTTSDFYRVGNLVAARATPLGPDDTIVRDITIAAADVPVVLAALIMARIASADADHPSSRSPYWRSWFRRNG